MTRIHLDTGLGGDVDDREKLFSEIKGRLVARKLKSDFRHPLNFTLVPMDWKFETGI